MIKKGVLPQLFSSTAFLLCALLLAGQAVGQQALDAGLQFGNEKDKAGDISVFRFTMRVPEVGDLVRTYLPGSVSYTGSGATVEHCTDESMFMQTKPISGCRYDASNNMIEFKLPGDVGPETFFTYELGYMRNPSYSQQLQGFALQVLDSQDPSETVLFENTEIKLRVNAGQLTSPSLESDSLQVAAIAQFTFRLTVTNSVPGSGIIEISFPLSHFEVPEDARPARLSINGGSWYQPQQIIWQEDSIRFIVPTTGVPAGASVILEIKDMANPNTMGQTDSFTVTTRTAQQETIDTREDGFVIEMTEPASLTVEGFDLRSQTVGQITYMTVTLILPTVYEANGYLTVTLPATVDINQSYFSCKYYIGFYLDEDADKCSFDGSSVVRIDGNVSQKKITFQVNSIVNPANTKTTDSFIFHIYDSHQHMIASTINQPAVQYTPTAARMNSVSIQRQDATVGKHASESANKIDFAVTSSNFMQSGEVIEFMVPFSQFILTGSPLDIKCQSFGPNGLSPVTTFCNVELSDSGDFFLLRYSVACAGLCQPGTTFTLRVINGISNPTWIPTGESLESIRATSYTQDRLYKIDESQSTIHASPGLIEGSLTSLALTKTPGRVGAPTDFSFSTNTLNAIPAGGIVTIEFEDDSLQLSDPVASPYCETGDGLRSLPCSADTHASGLISKITIEDPCGANTICPMDQSLSFKVSNVRNPRSTKPIADTFTVRTFTATYDGFAIDKGTMQASSPGDLTVEPAFFTSVTLEEPYGDFDEIVTGAVQQSYLMRIELHNGLLPKDGRLVLLFPEELQLTNSGDCQAYVEGSNEFLDCEVQTSTLPQSVIVKHTKPEEDYRGLAIMVRLTNKVKNPPSTKPSQPFSVRTELLDPVSNSYYFVDTNNQDVTVAANKPNQFERVTVTRSEEEVSSFTDLSICITTSNLVPANSKLTINYPQDQAILQGAQTYRAEGQNLSITQSPTFSQQRATIIIPVTIAAGVEYCIDVNGGILNPGKTSPPQISFEVSLETEDGYKIDETLTNIFAQPYLAAGPFLSAEIESFGDIVGKQATIDATMTLKSPLPQQSKFYVKLPTSTFYVNENDPTVLCQINSSSLASCFDTEIIDDARGGFVQSIIVSTGSRSFFEGDQVVIRLRNLRNKFDSAQKSSSELAARVQSYDNENHMINTSEVELRMPNLKANDGAVVLSATRSELGIQKKTSIEVSIQTETRLLSNSVVNLHLSALLFDIVSQSSISCSIDGISTLCSIQQQGDFNVITLSISCSFDGLCPDKHQLALTVSGLTNRYSTYRGEASIYEEVFIQTFEPTGTSQVDYSSPIAFAKELESGTAQLDLSSLRLSQAKVGHYTEFSFTVNYSGLATRAGDIVTINFDEIANDQESGKLFWAQYASSVNVYADDQGSNASKITVDANGVIKIVETPVPATNGHMTIRLINIYNLSRVQQLKARVSIGIKDSLGGHIADGISTIDDFNVLEPVTFSQVSISRKEQALASTTDIELSLTLTNISILPNSEITLTVPETQLFIFGSGRGTCMLLSSQNTRSGRCNAERERGTDNIILKTGPIIQGTNGSTIRILISGVFENPNRITYSNASISLAISNEGFAIGTSDPLSKIFVEPPLQQDKLEDLSVQQFGLVAGQSTEILFAFKLKSDVPYDSELIFGMPPGVVLASTSGVSLVCEARTANGKTEIIPCIVSTSQISDVSPSYVTEVRVQVNQRSYQMRDYLQADARNEMIFRNAMNADFVKDRAQSSGSIQVSIVSSGGFVVAQGSLSESELPNLNASTITTASLNRESISLGASNVQYQLRFDAVSLIQRSSYALVHLPRNEIKLREADFFCQITTSLRNLPCMEAPELASSSHHVIRMDELCKYDFCQPGEEVLIQMNLANSNSIVFAEDRDSIDISIFTPDGYAVSKLNATEPVLVQPQLEGSQMRDFEIERRKNKIGEDDLLKFYLPPQEKTMFLETHLLVELPDGIAYESENTICVRELENGQQVQLECDQFSLPAAYGRQALRSVRLRAICNQYHHCKRGEPLIFAIAVLNPDTNQKPKSSRIKVVLREESGLDVGYGQRDTELPHMIPSDVIVSMEPYGKSPECYRLGAVCHLMLRITTSNTVKPQTTGAYLQVEVPQNNFDVRGNECWAFIDDNYQGRSLSCVLNRNILQIRVADYDIVYMRDAQNRLKVIVEDVRMPLTVLQVPNAIVKNFERIESQVFSLVDTNQRAIGESRVARLPGLFKKISVRRQNAEIGGHTIIGLSIQPEFMQAVPFDETEVFIDVKVPNSAGRINRALCNKDLKNEVRSACRLQKLDSDNGKSSHTTLLVRNMREFCPKYSQECRIVLTDFINSWYATDVEDESRDSFDVSMFFFHEDGERIVIYEGIDGGVFARPTLEPLDISVTSIEVKPVPSQTAQEVSLSFVLSGDQDQIFDASPYLLAKFDIQAYKPVLSFESKATVTVDGQLSKFRMIETVDRDVDLSIKAMYIDLPQLAAGTRSITVQFSGLRNPNYVNAANSAGAIVMQVLGGSIDRTEIRAEASAEFSVDLNPYSFASISLFSTVPWPAQATELELEWSMTNRINYQEVYQVEIVLPDGFKISSSHIKCANLFNSESVPCAMYKDERSIVVGLTNARSAGSSHLSFTAVGLKIGPVLNPNSIIDGQPVLVRVLQAASDKVYIEGRAAISVLQRGEDDVCPASCAECTIDGICIKCKQPSTAPLLANGSCSSVCPDGMFQSVDRCLNCNSECSACHSLDQCTSCYSDESKVFVDGRCLSDCPKNTRRFETAAEAICIRDEFPYNEEPGANEDLPIFEVDQISAEEPDPCTQTDCAACGLSGDFCTLCKPGTVREGGQCVSDCKNSFFAAQGTCFKCSPLCATCSDTANLCDSCPHEGNLISAFTKLLPDQRMCVDKCPPGTFEELAIGTCLSCGERCNTCSGDADTCTSCFHDKVSLLDLYLFEGTCVEECPRMTRTNLSMHRCDPIKSDEVFSFDNWPLSLSVSLTAVSATVFALSRIVSRWQDRPWDLAAGLLAINESVLKWTFWITLWQSRAALLFAGVGVSIMCSALLSVFFYETTVLPVNKAIQDQRALKGVTVSVQGQSWVFRVVRLLAYASSMPTVRLLQANFCAIKAFKQDLVDESPCFYLKRLVQAAKAQMVLTSIWGIVAITSFFTANLTAAALGSAIVSLVISIASTIVQFKSFWIDREKSSGYRTLMAQD